MDGVLVLVLIGWIISQMSKKNKKAKNQKTVLGINKENPARLKAERTAKMKAEMENRKAQLAQKKTAALQQAVGEGESAAAPFWMEEAFRGSMTMDSTEGECICDPELEHDREQISAPESVYAGEIGREPLVDFSARGIMQGVVMSEILTRPVQRVRRR